jgi:hypothetical protein
MPPDADVMVPGYEGGIDSIAAPKIVRCIELEQGAAIFGKMPDCFLFGSHDINPNGPIEVVLLNRTHFPTE